MTASKSGNFVGFLFGDPVIPHKKTLITAARDLYEKNAVNYGS